MKTKLFSQGQSYSENIFLQVLHFWTSDIKGLKVVSATFFLVCFESLKETTYETKKNVFYFISKALFVLEKIKE